MYSFTCKWVFEPFFFSTITKDTVNICVQDCVEICFYFSCNSEMVELYGKCALNFMRNRQTVFAKQLYNFQFPRGMQGSSGSSTSSPDFAIASLFHRSHSIGYAIGVCYYFNLTTDVEQLFLCFWVIYIYWFVKRLIKSFAHLKNWVAYISLLQVEFLHIFWTQVLGHLPVLQILFQCGPHFHFFKAVFFFPRRLLVIFIFLFLFF